MPDNNSNEHSEQSDPSATETSGFDYINVRRYLAFIEHSIQQGLTWVTFEPNNPQLWAKVKVSIEQFLQAQFQQGALQGATPDQAYFVRCDNSTMTQADIDNGRLVVVIGVAPVMPAEFVVFHIGAWTGQPL